MRYSRDYVCYFLKLGSGYSFWDFLRNGISSHHGHDGKIMVKWCLTIIVVIFVEDLGNIS